MYAYCVILNCYLFMCVTELSSQTAQPLISYPNYPNMAAATTQPEAGHFSRCSQDLKSDV